ncbi:ABC transporter substrate-binding protein [Iodobacter sp.]|uniref:ABC transporter substrate-binding protein n=1 Tax=Iodobacter sp. TaxID=1915058 RepID=UPI0025E8E059|nr:ABC transporter substrate-binding protein [Iodobacter sp.]
MIEFYKMLISICLLLAMNAHAESLEVLHWWTSVSERRAADILVERLSKESWEWKDAAVPGGSGLGAMKVLKSRVLSDKAPQAAQLIGPAIAEWGDLGLLLELDEVAKQGGWAKSIWPAPYASIRLRGHVIAAPLGIHRINTLFYNRKIFKQLGLAAPQSWPEFERAAEKIKRAGFIPLAQSSEPWQVATLFEALVLSEGGPAYYRDLFVRRRANAFFDPRLGRALERLRALRRYMPDPLTEKTWTQMAKMLAKDEAAMLIMGDWVKGELNASGLLTDEAFSCVPVPGTNEMHLYSIDTLVMFAGNYMKQAGQEKLAQLLLTPAVQANYNKIKGSVPVRRDANVRLMDSCARSSWQTFAKGSTVQAPSLTHRMASDEALKDAIVAQVHRFFSDSQMPVSEAQRRMAGIVRALGAEEKEP